MGWFSKLFGGGAPPRAVAKIVVHEAFEGAIRVFEVPVGAQWQFREESREGDGFSVMTLRYMYPAEPMPLVLMVKIYVLDGPAEAPGDTDWLQAFGPLFHEEPELHLRVVEQTTMKAAIPAVEASLSGLSQDVECTLIVRERRSSLGNEQFIVGAVGPETAYDTHAVTIAKWFESAVVVPDGDA